MSAKKHIGLSSATALVIASMIGSGVFSTSGFLLADLGSPWYVLAAWAVGGVQAMLGALCYGALARRIPESGGEYAFLSRTLHPAAGYIAGWLSLLVGFSAPLAAMAYAFGRYAQPWLGGFAPALSGTILILFFAAVHGAEVRRGAQVQNWTVFVKILLIIGFVVLALYKINPPVSEASPPFPLATFGVSLIWISFSYSGWNAAVYITGEVRDPKRNLPRSLILGTGLVTLLYLALNAVFVFAAPVKALAGQVEVGRIAARAIGGSLLEEAVAALIAIVLMSSVSSLVMSGPRVYSKMAADGYLPQWLNPMDGPPRKSIALQTIIALALLWTASFEALLTYIGFTLSISTAATVSALILLRRREGKSLVVPGYPVIPLLFLAGVIAMTAFTVVQRPTQSLFGFATILAGLVAWLYSGRVLHKRNSE
jgi:basic amino acid/polyamine antiporter, APA family